MFALVRSDLGQGRPEAAETAIKLMGPVTSSSQRARLLGVQGDIYSSEGRLVKAEDSYQAAARLQPGVGYEWSISSHCSSRSSRFDSAIQLLRRLEAGANGDTRKQVGTRIAVDERRSNELEQLKKQALLGGAPASSEGETGPGTAEP